MPFGCINLMALTGTEELQLPITNALSSWVKSGQFEKRFLRFEPAEFSKHMGD